MHSKEEERDLLFGLGGCTPKFLQRFASINWFLLFLSIFSIMQGMLVNGLTSASIPHLEREFGFTSTGAGMILASNDFSGLLVVLVVSYYGGNGNKPKWLGGGAIITGIGTLIFSLPKFIKGPYVPSGNALYLKDYETCNINTTSFVDIDNICNQHSSSLYLTIFCISNMLAGLGTAPLYTLGATYLDENVSPKKSPLYIGFWYATTMLGPSSGYFVAGNVLTQWANIGENSPSHINLSSPLWVGRWWLPFATLSWILLVVGFVLLMFPKTMPGAAKMRQKSIEKGDILNKSKEFNAVKNAGFIGLAKATLLLIQNKFLVIFILGTTAKMFIGAGIGPFFSKALTIKFGANPADANILMGILLLCSSMLGLGIGSVVMSRIKVKASVKTATTICIITGLFTICTGFNFLIPGCETIKLANFNHDITASVQNGSLCSSKCGCLDTYFNPVCRKGVTYFSPCFAGCKYKDKKEILTYSNCSCIEDATSNITINNSVLNGKCEQGCKNIILFMVLTVITVVALFIGGTPQNMIIIRAVPENQRSFAMGLNFLLMRGFGMLPGPIVVGRIFDSACLVWKYDECGRRTNCGEYEISELSKRVIILIVVGKAVSCALYILGRFIYKEPKENNGESNQRLAKNNNIVHENKGYNHESNDTGC